MDVRRVRTWDWLTGIAGVVLLVWLFLPWYSVGGASATGWESFTVVDAVLAVAAVAAMSVPAVTAWQRTAAVPQALTASLSWLLIGAAVVALIRLIDPPADGVTREAGVWIGTFAAIAAAVFDLKAMRDRTFPAAMRPRLQVETLPAPAADGSRRDVS